MKKRLSILLISGLLLGIAVGCTGSNKMTKKAVQLEEAQMTEEAARYYLLALQRKGTNVDAQIGLKKTGQIVLNQQLSEFYRAFGQEDFRKAVYTYREAREYYEVVDRVHVHLDFPEYYAEYYKESKDVYLSERYEVAQKALDEERFADAKEVLTEIAGFDPEYADLEELKNYAKLEPKYREAKAALGAKKYRTAFYLFDSILQDRDYKDSRTLQARCKEKATYTIAFLPFENSTESDGSDEAIEAAIIQDILQSKDPFLRIIDREHLEILLDEQELGMTGLVNQQTAANAGNLVGARAVLSGHLVRMTEEKGSEKREIKKGYHAYVEKIRDEETGKYRSVTRYDKVYYKQYNKENKVSLAFQYKLISSETGEILLSDLIELNESDASEWARYDGDDRYLYPGTWERRDKASSSDRVFTGRSQRRELKRLLESSGEVSSIDELALILYRSAGQRVARKLITFNPEA